MATIRDSCDSCVEAYQRVLQPLQDDTFRLLRVEFDRLKIWAGNIGVYAKSPASADDRLSTDEELRAIVMGLLSKLRAFLERLENLRLEASGERTTLSSDSSLSSFDSQ